MSTGPNILMMTCHDLGQHLGCYGVDTVHSEAIDALAAEGHRFERYFAASPVCSPSRGCMLTGRYPQTNGLLGLTHSPWNWRFHAGETHMAAILARAGYRTTLIGFQHVTPGQPHDLGYQEVITAAGRAPQKAEAAAAFLKQLKERGDSPFFAKIGFTEVHRPYQSGGIVPDSEKGIHVPPFLADTEDIRKDLAGLQGSIRLMNGAVGVILAALEDSGLKDDTLVIFTSDHGIPYIGAKWTLFDPGLTIPLIFRWPAGDLTGGRVHRQLLSNVDFLPTLLDLAGVAIPDNLQGFSAVDILRGRTTEPVRDAIFAEHLSHALRDNTSRCIRTERYKLIRNFEPGRKIVKPIDAHPQNVAGHTARPRREGTRPVAQLFDLEADPIEYNNLALDKQHAPLLRELSDRLWRWMADVGDPILEGPIRTPYYEEAMADYRDFHSTFPI